MAEDLRRLFDAYCGDVMEKLGEEYPLGDGRIDGGAAHEDLMQYKEVREDAELAVLHFILTAGINASRVETERVTGALDVFLPASREVLVDG